MMCSHLAELDIRVGSHVGILARNSAEYVLLVHALMRLGAVLVPLNVRLSAEELRWQVADAELSLLVYDAAHEAKAREATLGTGVALHSILELSTGAAGDECELPPRALDLAATHSIIYTSGTTGRPKGALLTYGNHLASARASAANLGIRPDDRWLACLPFYHVGGLAILLRSALDGTPVVVQDGFEPAAVNRALDEQGVTLVSVVSTMLARMLEERGNRAYPPHLRAVLLGGGPAPLPLLRECARRGLPALPTYGMTETASQVATLPPEEAGRRLGTAGKPLSGLELRIEREDGVEAVPDEEGEILLRGPNVSPGYWKRPEETARAWRGGWFHTGDVGRLDADGYLWVLDRRDDLIISGGENVYPAEVESVLLGHPAVADAGVIGRPDASWGHSVAAVVVLRPGARAIEGELRAYCRGRLAGYKAPKSVEFVAALPRSAGGKLLRRELRNRRG